MRTLRALIACQGIDNRPSLQNTYSKHGFRQTATVNLANRAGPSSSHVPGSNRRRTQ